MTIIRNYIVELQKYLPEFLRQDPEMKTLLEVESKEHRVQVEVLKDIFDQFFVDTATWGLSLFEKNLGLQPNAGDNYTQRRNRILLKLNGTQTSTVEFLKRLIKRYLNEYTDVDIVEYPGEYSFEIKYINGGPLYLDDIDEAIETYKPAHLAYVERVQIEKPLPINLGIAAQYGVQKVKTAFNIPQKKKLPLNIGGVFQFGLECIGANIAKTEKLNLYFTYGLTEPMWDKVFAAKKEETPYWLNRSIVNFGVPMALG